MQISNSKIASLTLLAILLAICVLFLYQFCFNSMQESFVSLSTLGVDKKEDIIKFDNYFDNNKYNWDSSTIQLYKDFLTSQNISVNKEDFDEYINKLRTIYNQTMILELMSHETNKHKLLTEGVTSHNLLQPWDTLTMTLKGSEYIVK